MQRPAANGERKATESRRDLPPLLRRFLRSCLLRRRRFLNWRFLRRSFLGDRFLRRRCFRRLRGSRLLRRGRSGLLGGCFLGCWFRRSYWLRRSRRLGFRNDWCRRRSCCSRCYRGSAFRLASTLAGHRLLAWSRSGGGLATAALGSGGWWWRRRLIGPQEIHDLRVRSQLAVHQQEKRFVGDLRIFRQLRRNAKLRHFRERQLLLTCRHLVKKFLSFWSTACCLVVRLRNRMFSGVAWVRIFHAPDGTLASLPLNFLARS